MMNAVFALLGVISAALAVLILNKMPAKYFCDYDETPEERHNPPRAGKWGIFTCAAVLAIVFPVLLNRMGVGLESVFVCLFCAVILMIALSDLRFCIIPDELIIAGCLFATVSVFPGLLSGSDWATRLAPVLGAAVGAGVIFAINLLGRILYKKDALGMGDLKLMAVCGILCGPTGIAIALLIGVFAAGIFFAAGMIAKKVQSESYLPLGPFLVFGTVFTLALRPMIDAFLAWYISLI
jgi:leader peptidase (prepilin peptidase)/N-methyltransferase